MIYSTSVSDDEADEEKIEREFDNSLDEDNENTVLSMALISQLVTEMLCKSTVCIFFHIKEKVTPQSRTL